ncbi:MAG: hypothetical protein K2N64_05830 [Anaeroplasmataceae bacterium]|nr:hypothetical protein [Anaeroplasmataceae bacterium]
MKKYTLTALVLTLIAGMCAALIACINLVTAPIIQKNNEERKAKLCQEVFEAYTVDQSTIITEGFSSKSIKEIIMAYDSTGEFLGYIYTVEGSNAYGKIELLLGITADSKLAGVRFITNGQSFSSEADTHLNNSYKENMTEADVDNLDLKNSDVTAGATYASKLIRSLVKSAFDDAKTRQGGIN